MTVVVAASLVFVLAALAAGIVGTDRPETIRGTAGPDRISGRGGNDVLIGNGGRDVVDGGRGADRLSLRDGERDTAICGPAGTSCSPTAPTSCSGTASALARWCRPSLLLRRHAPSSPACTEAERRRASS